MLTQTILLTGGSGLVGSHTAEALRRGGAHVRALVRASSDTGLLEHLGVELLRGELEDPASLRRAVHGVDSVIHLAAATSARDEHEFHRINAVGTANLIEATLAEQHPASRFVYVSSMAAAGPSFDGVPVRPLDTPRPLTSYGRSKLAGERHCLSYNDRIQVVILRAPVVYGPRDHDVYHFFRFASRGFMPVPAGPPRPVQFIHVEDFAAAIDFVATTGEANGIYHVAEPAAYTWREVAALIAEALGRRVRTVTLPEALIRFAGVATERVGRLAGVSTIFGREKAAELLAPGWLCDTERTTIELGFIPRISLRDGVAATARWYQAEGWL